MNQAGFKTSIFIYIVLSSFFVSIYGQDLKFVSDQTTKQPNSSLTTPVSTPGTTPGSSTTSSWQGYVGAVIAVFFFGSNFIPVKKFETGDGMFFQWVFCTAIWIGGLITNCIQGFPTFYPLAMLGGFLWATGNICSVPVIKTIGLGLGLLIWGSFNLLSGWVSGRFGLFGLNPQIPNDPLLNYLSIGFAMTSAVFWMFVKSQPNQQRTIILQYDDDDDEPPLLSDVSNKEDITSVSCPPEVAVSSSWETSLSTTRRRIIGVNLSVFSGILYGLSFTPVIYIKDNYPNASQTDIDYVFAHFSGVYATSTLYFIIYCVIMKNKPHVYPSVILPALVSGGMWAAADIGWFVANNYLSEAVSFPIVTTGPGIIGSLWGLFVFHEVKGHRNYIIMAIAYVLTITGAVLAGLSKK